MEQGLHWMMTLPVAGDVETDNVRLTGGLTSSCELDTKLTASRLCVGCSSDRRSLVSVIDSYDFSGEPSTYARTTRIHDSIAIYRY